MSGWRRHKKLGESQCALCAQANRDYYVDRLKDPAKSARKRKYADARQRALSRLSKAHPVEFRALYEDEKGMN